MPRRSSHKTHQEIYGEVDVLDEMVVRHIDIADCHSQTQHLLHLEFDGALDIANLITNMYTVLAQNMGGKVSTPYLAN